MNVLCSLIPKPQALQDLVLSKLIKTETSRRHPSTLKQLLTFLNTQAHMMSLLKTNNSLLFKWHDGTAERFPP